MARRPSGRPRVSRGRQRVEWTAGDMETSLSLGPGVLASLGSSVIMLEAIDSMTSPTVVRVRGEVLAYASAGVADHECVFGSGMAVVNRRAAGVGTTALPRPISDPDYSWLWHSFLFFRFSGATQSISGSAMWRATIDSRAMRKILSKEEEIVFCFENNTTQTITIRVALSARVLLKES